MTTTRINHTDHNHPNTTAARTACRKALAVATPALIALCSVGKGKDTHRAVMGGENDTILIGARCGAGLQRGRRRASTIYRLADGPETSITCGRCNH